MGFPGKWKKTHLNQWNPSIFHQAHLKRTPMRGVPFGEIKTATGFESKLKSGTLSGTLSF